jgi:hypothetical protein
LLRPLARLDELPHDAFKIHVRHLERWNIEQHDSPPASSERLLHVTRLAEFRFGLKEEIPRAPARRLPMDHGAPDSGPPHRLAVDKVSFRRLRRNTGTPGVRRDVGRTVSEQTARICFSRRPHGAFDIAYCYC